MNLKVGCQTPCGGEHSLSATLGTICSNSSTAPRSSLKLLAWEFFQSPLHEILVLLRRARSFNAPIALLFHSTLPPRLFLFFKILCHTTLWCLHSLEDFPQAPIQAVASKPGISARTLIT